MLMKCTTAHRKLERNDVYQFIVVVGQRAVYQWNVCLDQFCNGTPLHVLVISLKSCLSFYCHIKFNFRTVKIVPVSRDML